MPETIWKYPFEVDDDVRIVMPRGARILHVAAQSDRPTVWAIVNTDEPNETRRFLLRGTGHALRFDRLTVKFVGSFFMRGGALVFHLFENITGKETVAYD